MNSNLKMKEEYLKNLSNVFKPICEIYILYKDVIYSCVSVGELDVMYNAATEVVSKTNPGLSVPY